jgi:hypothetical protein
MKNWFDAAGKLGVKRGVSFGGSQAVGQGVRERH